MAKQYKIIKATYEKLVGVIFECAILNNMNAPKWFSDFVEKQFKPNIAEIKADIADIKVRVSNLEARMTNVETEITGIKNRLDCLETKTNDIDNRLSTAIRLNNLKIE